MFQGLGSGKCGSSGSKIFLCRLIFILLLHNVNGFNFRARIRPCTDDSNDVRDLEFEDLTYEVYPRLSSDNENVELFVDIEWNITNNEGILLDGFAVHMVDQETKTSDGVIYYPLQPISPCHSGHGHMWVTTTNESVCEVAVPEIPECALEIPSTDACLCPQPNCTLFFPLFPNCRSTTHFLGDERNNFLTVRANTRKLTYKIEFHESYQFDITPYYRQFVNPNVKTLVVGSTDNCLALLMENLVLSHEVANSLCCRQGVKHLVAHNITFGESRPDFASGMINKTITWLPPGTIDNFSNFRVHIFSIMSGAGLPMSTIPTAEPLMLEATISPDATDDNCTYRPDKKYVIEAYDLLPNFLYRMYITSNYSDDVWCNGRCEEEFEFQVEGVNSCDPRFSFCDPLATCANNDTGNSSCQCNTGLHGNGLNKAFGGEGCEEINDCLSNNTGCVDEAMCIDRLSPNTGVNCSCALNFDGDGFVSGSGCSPKAVTALAIALPLAVLLVVVIAVAIWIIKLRRRTRKDIQFSQFLVESGNGIIQMYKNPNQNESDTFEPTFGDTWEIDRSNLEIGKVIGRGNYGVVHLALLKENSVKENGVDRNGEYRNGSFYDALSTNGEKNGNHVTLNENASVVAVKSLQESTRNHENLADFLAEIGFMLNIGKHENIVRIHGCCTIEEPVYLVTEYLQYGDLLHFLWDARDSSKGESDIAYKLTEHSLCSMALQVAKGMEYLEQIRIIHGDIAARNILVGTDCVCKISDFGLANDVYRYGAIKGHKERFVPYKWISPERMMSGQVPITSKSDVWSFGNLIYEMFTLGCPPHPGIRADELLGKLKEGYRMQQPKTCNDQIYGIINKCWRWRASSRPNFNHLAKSLETIIQHKLYRRDSTIDLVQAVEQLDREQYANEVNQEPTPQQNGHANGNVTLDENGVDGQTTV